MKISIGILAHNEAATIGRTLQSVFAQSALASPCPGVVEVEIICVANGCSDTTAAVARSALEAGSAQRRQSAVTWRVEELAEAGKSRAWNEYVHGLADPRAAYLFLMDADVVLDGPDVLRDLLDALRRDAAASVAVATAVKKPGRDATRSWFDRFAAAGAELNYDDSAPGICGMLYCGRGEVLRTIWMPPGLLVEDGFLRAMVVTRRFSGPEDSRHVVRVPSARVLFDAYRTVPSLFGHQRRLVIGTAVNACLFSVLWRQGADGADVGDVLRWWNTQDPHWVKLLMDREKRKRWWLLPRGYLWERVRRLRALPWRRRAARLPAAFAGWCLDVAVGLSANHRMRRGVFQW